MKLIVQIPCFNEAETLPLTLRDMPAQLPGITSIETLIVDDGSTDATVSVARSLGVTHVLHHTSNRGLAQAFQTGIDASLRFGADIIVNTDGDNQYPAHEIEKLIAPILRGEADIVIGDRQVSTIAHFSPLKKLLQRWGSSVVRQVSGTSVPDATSGFRAYMREAALRLTVLTRFSYTLETIMQAGALGLRIASVPIHTNRTTRPPRLYKTIFHFVAAQTGTIVRMYAFYEPLKTFSMAALPFFLVAVVLLVRFAMFYLSGIPGHVQSVAIGIGMLIAGIVIVLFGIQADSASKHRCLSQEILYRLKKQEFGKHTAD